jgi:hypothetical protein
VTRKSANDQATVSNEIVAQLDVVPTLPSNNRIALFQTRYYGEAFDIVVEIGLQENVIIFKGHATI